MSENRARQGQGGGKLPKDPAFLDRFKEFGPTSFAVDHRTSVVVLLVIIVVLGLYSYVTTPQESFPEIEIPTLVVNTLYPGVAPADVESLVTRPLEEDLSTISDIKVMTSTSVEGYSSIVIEFETTVNLDEALASVREKVDLAEPDLPPEAEEPMIVEINFSEVPVIQVNLAGAYSLVRLKEVGEDLQDRLEQIPAVLRVDLRGGLEREVAVNVDLSRLQYYNVSISDVIEAIASENVNIPGGAIDVGSSNYLVRVDGEFRDPALIGDVVVALVDGRPVYVRDVASVDFGFADRTSFARLDGLPVVTLDVIKRSGENVIETTAAVRAVVAGAAATFPPSTRVEYTSDISEDISMMVSSLENNIISGLILIVGVLLFFLGLGTSVFVAISIPTSMFLSFILIKAFGMTMNMVVLFSLILALGMLVDNAIVVVENIYRYMEEGWGRKWAAKKAAAEVAWPVIGSTATTLAAFTPLMFWPGIVGEFMGFLPRTLIITLASSLFVALTIVPTLCSMYMNLEDKPRRALPPAARWTILAGLALVLLATLVANPLTAVLFVATGAGLWWFWRTVLARLARRFQFEWEPRLVQRYERGVRWALDRRYRVAGGAFVGLLATFVAFSLSGTPVEFFPESIPPRQVFVDVKLPAGSKVEASDGIVRRIERELQDVPGRTDWKSSVAMAGGGGAGGASEMMGGGPGGPESGRVALTFVSFQDREYDSFETLGWLQERIGADVAGAVVSSEQLQEGPPTGAPVTIEIVGEDPAQLKRLSDRVLEVLEDSPVYEKLVGLESDLDEARQELAVRVDRERAALYDLSTSEVGSAIRGAIQGVEAAKYRTGEDEYDVIVRLAPEYRGELERLRDLTVMSEGRQIPLSSVASWEVQEGYGSIRRKDQDRMATLTSDVASGLNESQVLGDVRQTLSSFVADELPPGYSLNYAGQNQEQETEQEFLSAAFMTAVMLITLILVSLFNSVVKPLIIMTSVIMSTIGVLLGLMVFRMPFVIIMTGIGIISLAGVVVNNAIVLIDYIDLLRERDGLNRREALVRGGMTRFRPVILTATTTALGLVPLAVGLNLDFFGLFGSLSPELFWGGEQAAWWGSMCVAVIAGILFATFLTLVLVPVMYAIVDDMSAWLRRTYAPAEPDEGSGRARGPLPEEELPTWGAGQRPAAEPEAAAVVARGSLGSVEGLRPATE